VARPSRSKRSAAPCVRRRALELLARRDYTRAELERKLAPLADARELASLLDELTAQAWISEARLAEQYVHSRGQRFGPARLRAALLERGVSEPVIVAALAEASRDELETARAVRARRFANAPRTLAERARQVRFLQSRGFGTEIALAVVREALASGSA
jgi:regulatory protein